jgi:hypothetical protein
MGWKACVDETVMMYNGGMSKKDKDEVKKLRRKVEALKAELKSGSKGQKVSLPRPQQTDGAAEEATTKRAEMGDVLDIRPDLKKTFLLTLASLAIIAAAFLTQNQWAGFIGTYR